MNPRLKQALEDFQNVAWKYNEFGACDSEPAWHFHRIIHDAIAGVPFRPLDARGWELYVSSMDCTAAADALTSHAKLVYDLVRQASPKDIAELKAFAWRVS